MGFLDLSRLTFNSHCVVTRERSGAVTIESELLKALR